MLNLKQFRESIIQPALKDIDLYSKAAEELLVLTCAAESDGGTYIKQTCGPALGIFQMEAASYGDLFNNYLKSGGGNPYALYKKLLEVSGTIIIPKATRMIYDLRYATMIARIFYYRSPEPLPDATDVEGLATLYKSVWNTSTGSATIEGTIRKYKAFLAHDTEQEKT